MTIVEDIEGLIVHSHAVNFIEIMIVLEGKEYMKMENKI